MTVLVNVTSRSGRELVPGGLALDDQATVASLKDALHRARPALYPSRQRLTLPPAQDQKRGVVLADDKTLAFYGIGDESTVLFKDLGPQIGYRTVFFWEYFGPAILYLMPYFFPRLVYCWYDGDVVRRPVQHAAAAYFALHYAKREIETFTVHRFSHATMPIFNLVKNCAYYWGFALVIGYFNNHPQYSAPNPTVTGVALALATLCQIANLRCHVILSGLRPPGGKGYVIPRGFWFDYITCANYTAEILGWLFFSVATCSATALLFTIAGAGQMSTWAAAKHRRLRQIFDGKDGRERYPRRWIMLPPFF